MQLLAIDKKRLSAFQTVNAFIAHNFKRASFRANKLAVGVPVGKVLRIAVFSDPDLFVFAVIAYLMFNLHRYFHCIAKIRLCQYANDSKSKKMSITCKLNACNLPLRILL